MGSRRNRVIVFCFFFCRRGSGKGSEELGKGLEEAKEWGRRGWKSTAQNECGRFGRR